MARRFTLLLAMAALGLACSVAAEAATPANAVKESLQVTAHATHDEAHISWDAPAGRAYDVRLYEGREFLTSSFFIWPSAEFSVGPQAPYELTIDGLDPDRVYVVELAEPARSSRYSTVVSFQTEPVPPHWWEANIAENIGAAAAGDRIIVYWTCLHSALDRELEVEIKEYGAPQASQSRTLACRSHAMLSKPFLRGTRYEVAIRPSGLEDYRRTMEVAIPGPVGERAAIADALPQWDVAVSSSRKMPGWAFTVSVESDTADLLEVEWIRDGRRMTRVGPGPTFVYYSDDPGPYPFRIRWLDRQGTSSTWSPTRLAGAEPWPPSQSGIRYQRRGSELHVTWPYGGHPSGSDGYRAFLIAEGAAPQVIDTGLSNRAVFELVPGQTSFVFLVGAYRHDLGLGDLARLEIDLRTPPELELRIDDWQSRCKLRSSTPARAFWQVRRGVPPYRVTVGDHEPITSTLPVGAFESGCTSGDGRIAPDGRRVMQVTVQVEDDLGQRMSETLVYEIIEDGELSAAIPPALNRARSVAPQLGDITNGSDRVAVLVYYERSPGWELWELFGGSRFWIRWRVGGQEHWTYERDNVEIWAAQYLAVAWSALEPDTAYEFQLALDFPGVRAEEIPAQAWSILQEVRTWPEAVRAEVSRVGTSITVRWNAVPGVPTYSVVLRGAGESWWQRHDASGADVETIVFEGIPPGTKLDVEVIMPPVGTPQWVG